LDWLDGLDRAGVQHAALVEHGEDVGHVADEVEVVLDDEDGATGLDRRRAALR